MSVPSSSASKPSGMWHPPSLEEMQGMLPQYHFVSLLGRGGMGAVYKAMQISLDRAVAIKVLPGDLVLDEDSQFAERFKNEARTMAKMNHPSIVNVFDFGETQTGLLYIVMEFIHGTDVAQLILSQGRLTPAYALAISEHVCDALNYAHRSGIVHRDIKPANILINMDGAVKVADFGLAKANDAAQSGGLTKTNMAMGTPDYVAPEAFIPGFSLDGRADLYAIGVMLYQMLTGEVPRGMWTMPSQKIGSDPRFDAVIAKAMQTDREMRYQSASEIHQDLHSIHTTPLSIPQQPAPAPATPASTPRPMTGRPQSPSKSEPEPPPPPQKSSANMIYGIAAVVVTLGMAALIFSTKEPEVKIADTPVMQTAPEPAVPVVKPVPIVAKPPTATPVKTEIPPAIKPAAVPGSEVVATAKPMLPVPEMPAPTVTPAPVPVDPAAEQKNAFFAAHPRLTQLETGFKNRLEADALKTYRTALANLNQSYLTKGIPTKRSAAQAKGNLVEVTALDAETALIKSGGSVPTEDSADTPAVLVALRQAYRGAEAALAKTRDEKAAPIYAIYVRALDTYIAELTQMNKIADAQQVKALRDEIATKKTEISSPAALAAPAEKSSSKALTTTAPKPTTSSGSSWRVAAEYLTKNGGLCAAIKNGSRIEIKTANDIPAGRFDITELTLDHLNAAFQPPKAADLRTFNGLRDLQRVWIRLPNSTLTDSAYAWLVGNEELNWINFESGGDLTDEVLINLSSAKKLDFLQVNYAPRFTGAGLERMPFADTLTIASFLGTGFSDDGLRGLANYKKLSILRLSGTKVTDSGFAALAGVKTLTDLNAEQTGFGNEAAAVIATLPAMSILNLNSTQITDKGLEKLGALKSLTSLSLSDTKVSAQAAGAYQIAHPHCRVSR